MLETTSTILTIITAAFSVLGSLFMASRYILKKYKKHKVIDERNQIYALVDRFVLLFKAHCVERTQIPRFLGEQYLSLSDVSTDDKLLHKLNEAVLSTACGQFGIQRAWLDGKSDKILENLWFYQNMGPFLEFMSHVASKYKRVEGFAIKSFKDNLLKLRDRDLPIALLFRAEITRLDDEPIYRYYIIDDDWFWGYEKTRLQFIAMVFIAFRFKAYIGGYDMQKEDILKLISGTVFPGPIINKLHHVTWHPDDYIFTSQESAVATDDEDALKARELIRRYGLMKKLEALTGPIGDVVRP